MSHLYQVAKTVRIGTDKVLAVRTLWYDKQELYETNGKGRGKVTSVDDRRRVITKEQEDGLNEFITSEHEAGRQVFVKDYLEVPWLQALQGCRIKIPPLNEERKNRIRLFLVKMDLAKRAEDAGVAVIVYMDESFVHQAHGSAYSYFPSNDKGVVQDEIGRTTGKGVRMIMVHAITKHGPLAELQEGFPIREDEQTAGFLWQAKLATGDYHNTMMDGMFMQWLKHRLTPAFDAQKKYNVELLRKYGCTLSKVTRESEGKAAEYNFEVPAQGSLPKANRKNGVSKEEIDFAETYMREKGLGLIWTPPYMPTFQPIELFWQHGKHYVSIHFEKGRTMLDVWRRIRLGWYGNPEWDGQEGGWKTANCGKLVEHAIGKKNEWIGLYGGSLSGTIGSLEYPMAEYREGMAEDEIEDGVEEQTDKWLGEDAEDAMEG
ncbi:unnamed protein product [Ectocarpus sp. CCAP 1310/34]|nr:unnamed protein product [Ectocarpus sp. CCAP 1310/34]